MLGLFLTTTYLTKIGFGLFTPSLRLHISHLPFCDAGSDHCQISQITPLLKNYKTYVNLDNYLKELFKNKLLRKWV